MSRPVKNWELKDPSTVIFFGRNGPWITNGILPPLVCTSTRSWGNTSAKKSMGLVNILPFPVKVIWYLHKAANGANMRSDKPLSPAEIKRCLPGYVEEKMLLSDWITTLFCTVSTVAPNCCTIFLAASSSLLWPAFSMMVVPLLISAAAQARCMQLFEGGAVRRPFTAEGEIVTITVNY